MNIIVTGASRGIGYELVKQFSREQNNRVFALARSVEKLKKLKEECLSLHPSSQIEIVEFDIEQSHDKLLVRLKEIDSVDILINNAGYLLNCLIENYTDDIIRRIFEVNAIGPIRLVQTLLPFLKNSHSAHVINIGSMGGFQGASKFHGLSAYSSSKAALACFTECMAEEFKETQIKANCLALGAVQTEMLEEAFPGYVAPVNAKQMAKYIAQFAQTGHALYNGKVLPLSLSTP